LAGLVTSLKLKIVSSQQQVTRLARYNKPMKNMLNFNSQQHHSATKITPIKYTEAYAWEAISVTGTGVKPAVADPHPNAK